MEYTDGVGAIRRIILTSGKTQRGIAGELKRSPTFLSNYLTRGACPSINLGAEIAKACGWKLQFVRDDGEKIVIRP